MPTSTIDSRLMTFGELLATNNAVYVVPSFQRDYSWTETEVEQLWNDIKETINDEKRSEYFMGAVVVNNSTKPQLSLIDGQQRVTTIFILMCVLRDIAKQKGDELLAQTISQQYLGKLDLRTRKIESKLVLNDKNNRYFQEKIVESKPIDDLKEAVKKRNLDQSNKLLLNAYLLLHQKVQEHIEKTSDFPEIIECVRDKLICILISVSDEANSYLIFETLNDRGLELSVADLLKNYLFSRAGKKIKDFQSAWTEINKEIDRAELTKFIRYYWLSRYGVVREKDLYRNITKKIQNPSEIASFVSELRDASEVYSAFDKPDSPIWNLYDSSVKKDLELLRLFNVTLCNSLLLSSKQNLPDELFPKVLRMVVILSFRYNFICGFSAVKLEAIYSDAAIYVREQKPKNVKEIFHQIDKGKVYPSDSEFVNNFEVKSVTNPKLARYILSEINSYHTDGKELVANPNGNDVNLEHILPQKPNENWLVNFSKKTDAREYIYRLGNMTLLDSTLNRKIGNTSFPDKCAAAFSKSKLILNEDIVSCSTWGPKEIEERQKRMAKAACQIWRLDY
ncbi:MAG: DUF262 domain-containing HNH endonuclease family protein [Nostocaceae cyanobacterium]|nr:DUF262 domain-containing HNH endonuclease family protein [Nostocaceae cyanobacterium]